MYVVLLKKKNLANKLFNLESYFWKRSYSIIHFVCPYVSKPVTLWGKRGFLSFY